MQYELSMKLPVLKGLGSDIREGDFIFLPEQKRFFYAENVDFDEEDGLYVLTHEVGFDRQQKLVVAEHILDELEEIFILDRSFFEGRTWQPESTPAERADYKTGKVALHYRVDMAKVGPLPERPFDSTHALCMINTALAYLEEGR